MNLKICIKKEESISYNILIKEGNIKDSYKYIEKYIDHKICVITDSNIYNLYPQIIADFDRKFSALVIVIPFGEKSKSREEKARIEDILLENKFNRKSLIIGLGGGVVGDLSGFVASTYHRGIDFIQIPTSLLSMVDSSIGGKTAISTSSAKNVIGSFYHPKSVFIDPTFLMTLPINELISGLVESIKMGLILDEKLFSFIEENIDKILKSDMETLKYIIHESINLKSITVMNDEKESHLRQILNYGHSIGHAIETLSDYKILHGESVAIGINYAGLISRELNIIKQEDLSRQNRLLEKLGLDINIPKGMNKEEIIKTLKSDKKNSSNKINFVLLEKIGKVYRENGDYIKEIPEDIIYKIL